MGRKTTDWIYQATNYRNLTQDLAMIIKRNFKRETKSFLKTTPSGQIIIKIKK